MKFKSFNQSYKVTTRYILFLKWLRCYGDVGVDLIVTKTDPVNPVTFND